MIILLAHYKKINKNYFVNDSLKILKKNIVFEKNYWKINAAHDGYQKKIPHNS